MVGEGGGVVRVLVTSHLGSLVLHLLSAPHHCMTLGHVIPVHLPTQCIEPTTDVSFYNISRKLFTIMVSPIKKECG